MSLCSAYEDPTAEEHFDEVQEDDVCAKTEAGKAGVHLPQQILARPFHRPQPVLLCLSRDVPAKAKEKLVRQLEDDLPGLTIHIDRADDMGLRVDDLQRAFSAGCVLYMCHTFACIAQWCTKQSCE